MFKQPLCPGAVLALSLLLAACSAQSHDGEGTPDRWTSATCRECHGTRGAGASPEALTADIVDTHFDDQHLDADGALVQIENVAGDAFVLDPAVDWSLSIPGGAPARNPPGFVVEGAEDQCAASCHAGHDHAGLVREQYARSSHADRESHWISPTWGGFSTTACFQCHSGAGFALYTDPATTAWRPPDHSRPLTEGGSPGGDLITCNTCHLGTGLPSGREPLLRAEGAVTLTSGTAPATDVVDGTVDAGRGAACVICHSGRESGGSLFRAMVAKGTDPYDGNDETITGQDFIQAHYQAAGATLFSLKAYELPGHRYSPGNLFHQSAGCVGCHMPDSDEVDLGGHSLRAARDGGVRDNATCRECHGSTGRVWSDYEAIGPAIDADGDGSAEPPIEELHGLYDALIEALAAQGVHYNEESYPYVFNTPDPAQQNYGTRLRDWTESQLIAAYNLHFLSHDTGVHVHNYLYAAQVLRDSLELITGSVPPGTRPTSPYDRETTSYAP
ncbi:MAG: hypothetical protein P1V51_03705 [Deltaproteobacteria bacterium]|nr:hypothetical protein [Deltaproteobacteria bacterium]